jgi:hypothetical protein
LWEKLRPNIKAKRIAKKGGKNGERWGKVKDGWAGGKAKGEVRTTTSQQGRAAYSDLSISILDCGMWLGGRLNLAFKCSLH